MNSNEKDSLRYDWLKTFLKLEPVKFSPKKKLIRGNFYWSIGDYEGDSIDEAIDLAIENNQRIFNKG